MKKLPLTTIFFVFIFLALTPPVFAVTPVSATPTIEPVPTTDEVCPDNGTVYPPNSSCHPLVKKFEVQEVNLSGTQTFTYPLSCIAAPSVTYKEIYTGLNPPRIVLPNVTTNVQEVTSGFLGPDSKTLSTTSPDKLAQKYLFNALFDRPGADPDSSRESFRTFWRMLDSLSQAQLKAYYIKNTDNHVYYYVGADKKQHKVELDSLRNNLPFCLKNFGIGADILACWENNKYVNEYLKLDATTQEEYDALLPFDFNNMRSYIVLGGTVSKENIPYLKAILSGLKGNSGSVPGLFDFYTPSWASQDVTKHVTAPTIIEPLQYPSLILRASLYSCELPSKATSLASPQTYPDVSGLTQIVPVIVSSRLISSSQLQCNQYGYCVRVGEDRYELTGSATGEKLTVFNNPNIETLNDLVVGGKDPIGSKSKSDIVSNITGLVNDFIGIFTKAQPSFYKMLLPDAAPGAVKTSVNAPSVSNSTDNPNTTVSGPSVINREDNLAQDTMHLLQNCWLVPSDQQSSGKCGLNISEGTCDGTKFKEIVGDSPTSPSSKALSFYSSYIESKLTSEVIAAYSKAEEVTGVPCEVLAGIHFEEGGNNPNQSLQDGRSLSGSLVDSAIKAAEELKGKAGGGDITDLDTLIYALSRYNGGGNSNCQPSSSCSAASSLDRCGSTVDCAKSASGCRCVTVLETGSCRSACGSGSFPWPISYNYCPSAGEGYDDPYVTNWWKSPEHDNMYLLFAYDCTQTPPRIHTRPGALTVALSIYLSNKK